MPTKASARGLSALAAFCNARRAEVGSPGPLLVVSVVGSADVGSGPAVVKPPIGGVVGATGRGTAAPSPASEPTSRIPTKAAPTMMATTRSARDDNTSGDLRLGSEDQSATGSATGLCRTASTRAAPQPGQNAASGRVSCPQAVQCGFTGQARWPGAGRS